MAEGLGAFDPEAVEEGDEEEEEVEKVEEWAEGLRLPPSLGEDLLETRSPRTSACSSCREDEGGIYESLLENKA